MKVILKFDLPEEHEDLKTYLKAHDYYSALFDIHQFIRSKLKHENVSIETETILEEIRTLIPELYE